MGSVNPQNHKKCKSYSRYNEKFLDREISLWDNSFIFIKEERVMQNIWLAIIMILAVIIVLHDNVCLRNATFER